MKKFIFKGVKLIIESILATMWFLGVLIIANDFLTWINADVVRSVIFYGGCVVAIVIMLYRELKLWCEYQED